MTMRSQVNKDYQSSAGSSNVTTVNYVSSSHANTVSSHRSNRDETHLTNQSFFSPILAPKQSYIICHVSHGSSKANKKATYSNMGNQQAWKGQCKIQGPNYKPKQQTTLQVKSQSTILNPSHTSSYHPSVTVNKEYDLDDQTMTNKDSWKMGLQSSHKPMKYLSTNMQTLSIPVEYSQQSQSVSEYSASMADNTDQEVLSMVEMLELLKQSTFEQPYLLLRQKKDYLNQKRDGNYHGSQISQSSQSKFKGNVISHQRQPTPWYLSQFETSSSQFSGRTITLYPFPSSPFGHYAGYVNTIAYKASLASKQLSVLESQVDAMEDSLMKRVKTNLNKRDQQLSKMGQLIYQKQIKIDIVADEMQSK